ncbi:hypothetical protein [Longivirga aurantiaca]|uniref:ABC transporter permease n=1 Tax=Longivirga aurantiaca TaxID=1837743 RepID=A0ABW1SZJ2_9ACTN
MTTQTISAISTPSRRALALGAAVSLTVAALLIGAIAGAGAAAWWQSRTAAAATTTTALVVPRTALDPATHHYGARAAQFEAAPALATAAAAPVAVARPALDPATHHYGARATQLEAVPALAATGTVLRTPVDPESRFYGRTRLARTSSPDVVAPVAAAQVSTPETHLYGARSGS